MTDLQKAQQQIESSEFWNEVYNDYINLYISNQANSFIGAAWINLNEARTKALSSTAYDLSTDGII